ncbi:unnamed protein product [Rhizoctonia solani]|uniref:Uncharacterized protein n=1 Tax=Rhizoctonia solani TaxID=456999 RepID=A0A8H3D9L5_9AGAM|nr:unnamed protein product [Rhizoctonia solani]
MFVNPKIRTHNSLAVINDHPLAIRYYSSHKDPCHYMFDILDIKDDQSAETLKINSNRLITSGVTNAIGALFAAYPPAAVRITGVT